MVIVAGGLRERIAHAADLLAEQGLSISHKLADIAVCFPERLTTVPAAREPSEPAEVLHRFPRKGRTLPVRVRELSGTGGRGHMFVFGDARDGCLVRIHSQCLYGEAMGSDSCDCGPELDLALDLIYRERAGVLIYLEQEGRGSGLMAKAQGYAYSQTYRTNTFESYERLGFPHDSRDYTSAIDGLRALGFLRSVKLLTNNPRKVVAVRDAGFSVSRVRLYTKPKGPTAAAYLDAKRLQRDEVRHGLWSPHAWGWLTVAKWSLRLLAGLAVALGVWSTISQWQVLDARLLAAALAFALAVAFTRLRWQTRPLSPMLTAYWDKSWPNFVHNAAQAHPDHGEVSSGREVARDTVA